MNDVVFSSERQDWETPHRFFAAMDAEFSFTLDSCATADNAKCRAFFSPDEDALSRSWAGIVWMNPPYGYEIGKWISKAFEESRNGATVVCLIPAKTETRWWHEYVMRAHEVRLIRGRLRFSRSAINAPFPSAVVVFRPGDWSPIFRAMDRILDDPEVR